MFQDASLKKERSSRRDWLDRNIGSNEQFVPYRNRSGNGMFVLTGADQGGHAGVLGPSVVRVREGVQPRGNAQSKRPEKCDGKNRRDNGATYRILF